MLLHVTAHRSTSKHSAPTLQLYEESYLSSLRRDLNRLRIAIRNWDPEEAEKAWEDCEKWIGTIEALAANSSKESCVSDNNLASHKNNPKTKPGTAT